MEHNKNSFIFNFRIMKKLIIKVLIISQLANITVIGLILSSDLLCRRYFSYDVPEDRNMLIAGDSHPECAITDEVLTNSFNLSQSGSTYYYTYLKVREMIDHNPQIDTLILGYAFGEIDQTRDEWYFDEELVRWKLSTHSFLMRVRITGN